MACTVQKICAKREWCAETLMASLIWLEALGPADAACRCACVSGCMKPVCSSVLDARPSCGSDGWRLAARQGGIGVYA